MLHNSSKEYTSTVKNQTWLRWRSYLAFQVVSSGSTLHISPSSLSLDCGIFYYLTRSRISSSPSKSLSLPNSACDTRSAASTSFDPAFLSLAGSCLAPSVARLEDAISQSAWAVLVRGLYVRLSPDNTTCSRILLEVASKLRDARIILERIHQRQRGEDI